jgi:catechol 2,3-dioxygenase-like lactoylglutathione lyase family enzyme
MTITGIDTVAIVVSDRKKALQWYRDILGLQVAYVGPFEPNTDASAQGSPERPGHWIELGPGRPLTRLHICELKDSRTEAGPTGITFLTNNIQTDYERLLSKGVRFLYPPKKMEWGEWLCEFADADGNEFDLKQPFPPTESTTQLS